MEPKHNEWKILQLFTVSVVAAIVSSALSNAALVEAAPISEPKIEDRLAAVKSLKNRGESMTDSFYNMSST